MERRYPVGDKAVLLVQGDITEARVDAIVNAANERLLHGGGVAGAIARRGGPAIQAESLRKAPVPTGGAAVTGGGRLPARYVVHAVGPRGGQPDADRLLESAVTAALQAGEENGVRTIAFPAISTGIFGYPLESCAAIMTRVATEWLRDPRHGVEEIRLVLYDDRAYRAFDQALDKVD